MFEARRKEIYTALVYTKRDAVNFINFFVIKSMAWILQIFYKFVKVVLQANGKIEIGFLGEENAFC